MKSKSYSLLPLLCSIIFMLITTNLIAQDYYPLEIGNRWDYESISCEPMTGECDTTFFSVEVISDTTLNNSEKYFIINPRDLLLGKYIRADSSFIYYYDENDQEEDTLFNLNANIGDIWHTDFGTIFIIELEARDTINFLGHTTKTLRFKLDGLTLGWITLSDIFGPITYTDWGDPPGNTQAYTFTYHCIIGGNEFGEPLLISNFKSTPLKFMLEQNYPNPFNPRTAIRFTIPQDVRREKRDVKLVVYDILGNEIATLVNEEKPAGSYEVEFSTGLTRLPDGQVHQTLPSGIYFYQLRVYPAEGGAGSFVETKKMILLK